MLLLLFVIESPYREELSLRPSLFFSFFPIVSVIIVLFIFFILSDHSFHYFHASFEGDWIPSTFFDVFLFFIFTFLLIFLFFLFEAFNITIPNIPLCNLSSQIVSDGRTCGCSLFLDIRINCLNFSAFIIKLIPHGLFYCFHILSWSRFFLFSLPSEFLEVFFSIFLNFLLNFVLVMISMNVISFQTKVND